MQHSECACKVDVCKIALFTVDFLICITMQSNMVVRQFQAEAAKLPKITSQVCMYSKGNEKSLPSKGDFVQNERLCIELTYSGTTWALLETTLCDHNRRFIQYNKV